jgi:hypothetical protein
MLNTIVYSSITDSYLNYNFSKNPTINFISNIKKSNNYNLKDHDNLFLNTLHKEIYKTAKLNHYYSNINNINNADLLIVINSIPQEIINNSNFSNCKKYLILGEPRSIIPFVYKKEFLKKFDKIFTYDQKILDTYKTKAIYASLQMTTSKFLNINIKKKKFFSCLFSSYKPNEFGLFNEKIKAIKWFNKNQPSKLHLYGRNWNLTREPKTKNIMIKFFRRLINFFIPKLNINFFYKKYLKNTYKGYSINKIKDGSNYYFQFCYENDTRWISQKIFHCFMSGSIPIYLGCSNIKKSVPSNCYIEKKKYRSYDLLFKDLQKIASNNILYNKYLTNIKNFSKGKKIKKFFLEEDVKIIKKQIFKDFNIEEKN